MYAARYPKSEKMREKIGTQMQESARIEAADWLRTGAARGATVLYIGYRLQNMSSARIGFLLLGHATLQGWANDTVRRHSFICVNVLAQIQP